MKTLGFLLFLSLGAFGETNTSSERAIIETTPQVLAKITETGTPPGQNCHHKEIKMQSFSRDYGMCKNTAKLYEEKDDGSFHNGLDNGVAKFRCIYECLGPDGPESIKTDIITRVFTPGNMSQEARTPICPHIKIAKSKWEAYEGTPQSFYAHNTQVKEVKDWARTQITRNNPNEKILLEKLKADIERHVYKLAKSQVSNKAMADALSEMFIISVELPDDTQRLDEVMRSIKENPPEKIPFNQKERWLFTWMRGLASFRFR